MLTSALEDESVGAVVQAWVALGEGSPRSKGAGVHPDQDHPHPWIRYLLIVEKAWKKDLQSFWIERPWGRCGSPLQPGYRYLLTLPSKADESAGVIAGEPAFTVGGCQEILRIDRAEEQVAALGKPTAEYDLNEVAGGELSSRQKAVSQSRRYCLPELTGEEPAKTVSVSMVPGTWSKMEVEAPSVKKTWQVAQNGTSAAGVDEVLLFADNPGACWLRVSPQVERRWGAQGSARRALSAAAGLTFRKGWVPPYWRGTISMGTERWIRDAKFEVKSFSVAPMGAEARYNSIAEVSSKELRIEKIEPAPGSHVNEETSIRVAMRWLGEISAGKNMQVQPLFQATDQMLVLPRIAGDVEARQFTSDNPVIDFEFSISPEQASKLRKPLQLRFVVNRGSNPSEDGKMIDSTKPLEYQWGIEPKMDPVPPPKQGPWYAGGAGDGCEDAIVVRGVGSIQEGIAAERAWWRKEYPGSEMTSQGVSTPTEEGGPAYDLITLKLADGETKELCFEITEFWGAPARPQRRPPP